MVVCGIDASRPARARQAVTFAVLILLTVSGAEQPAWGIGPGAQRVAQVAGSPYGPDEPVVALTFDDGPDPVTTPQILDILAARGAKATFFVLGGLASRYPDLVKRIAREGHVVAGHTWNHARLTGLSEAAFRSEVDGTNIAIESLTGQPVRCVRPPEGISDQNVVARLGARGLTTMQWSLDPLDWTLPGVDTIVNRVLGSLHPGAVAVLHDRRTASQTPASLHGVLDGLDRLGYRTVTICSDGIGRAVRPEVISFGAAPPLPLDGLVSRAPLVSGAGAAMGQGLRLAAADGGVFSVGGASFHGSAAEIRLQRPVVTAAATPSGGGYWLAGSDGGVFAFGDAPFAGRAPEGLRRPVVGMAPTPTGRGYWLVGGDGGVFAFGDAPFLGAVSVPVMKGMAPTPTGQGYWLVGADGGVFAFGDAPFLGSAASLPLQSEIVGIAGTATGHGYWLLGADGGVFAFGDAQFLGTPAGAEGGRAVAITPTPAGDGYWVLTERPA